MKEWYVSTKYPIIRCSKQEQSNEDIDILVEYTLSIFINDVRYINLICTYKDLYELVIGNLYGEGIIEQLSDIQSLQIDEIYKDMVGATEGIRTVTTACGKQHSIAYYY